jgi:hypothetical protein
MDRNSKEVSWNSMADWALGGDWHCCSVLVSSSLSCQWSVITISCSQQTLEVSRLTGPSLGIFRTALRKLDRIWTSRNVAPGSEGSSRNTPSARVAGVLEAATGAKRTASLGGTQQGKGTGQDRVRLDVPSRI